MGHQYSTRRRRIAARQRHAGSGRRRVRAGSPSYRDGQDDQIGPNAALSGPQRTVANYVPHATTIFDFTRRAMPWSQPKSLSNDEVYAVTAYIAALNKIIGDNDTMNAQTLPKVRMPNRDGFVSRYPDKH